MRPLVFVAYKFMAMVMSVMTALGLVTMPNPDAPVEVDENADLTFVAWGDPQVSNYMFKRQANFSAACADVLNTKGTYDALILAGDIAENGLESEYKTVADMLNPLSEKVNNFLFAAGNHDARLKLYSLQTKRFASFAKSVKNAVVPSGKSYNYSYEINGYKFIVMGPDSSAFEASKISDEQLNWLDSEIASSQGKPVFVINHHPLKNTHGLPGTWNAPEFMDRGSVGDQSDQIKAVFNKHSNVVYISGHLHTGTGEYSYEKIDNFHAFNLQTIGAGNDDGVENDAQGYVFEVYGNKVVARARIFGEGKWVDENVANAVVTINVGE